MNQLNKGDKEDTKKIRYDGGPADFKVKYMKYKAKYMKLRSTSDLDAMVGGNEVSVPDHSQDLSNWENKQENGPVAYYSKMVAKYGKPTYCVNQPGGACKWIRGKTEKDIFPHEKIMLKDEFVHHTKPQSHYDFMYSICKVYVPPESLVDVIKISESVNYDPLMKYLRARCGSFAANFATFRTVFDVLDKKESDYGTNIGNKEMEEESNEEYVTRKVRENQEKYANELMESFYDLDRI